MSFAFRNRMLKIDIAGTEFEIEIDAKNNELMRTGGPLVLGAANDYKEGKKTEAEAIIICKDYINEVLCDVGASDKIFKDRTPDLRDCLDIITYIVNEIAAFNQANALAAKSHVTQFPTRH